MTQKLPYSNLWSPSIGQNLVTWSYLAVLGKLGNVVRILRNVPCLKSGGSTAIEEGKNGAFGTICCLCSVDEIFSLD